MEIKEDLDENFKIKEEEEEERKSMKRRRKY